MQEQLIIEDFEGETTVVPLSDSTVTIGRRSDNTIQLTERNVSRCHAKLSFSEAGWKVQDLSSYNGVRVNGIQIDSTVPLRTGDRIRIGDYRISITNEKENTELTPESSMIAANDDLPLVASSTTNLPVLTREEIESIRRGEIPDNLSEAFDPDDHVYFDPHAKIRPATGMGFKWLVALVLTAVIAAATYLLVRGIGGDIPEVEEVLTNDLGFDEVESKQRIEEIE